MFKIYLLLGYVLLSWHVCCFLLFVCSLFVLFCFKVWWRSLKSRVIADIGGHDPEYPVNDLAIRRYHVIYTIPYTGTQWRGSSKCRKQTVCVELDDHGMSSSLHDLHKGLKSEIPPQRIWNSHIILHSWMNVLVKFQIGIRFFTELHGNSKLSMT